MNTGAAIGRVTAGLTGCGRIVPLAAMSGTALACALGSPAPAAATPRIVDVTAASGIRDVTTTWSAEAGDLNDDGSDDLLVGNHHAKPAYLYINRNDGTFTRVATRFRTRDRHDCSFGDANGDGRQDIYCSIGGSKGSGLHSNELWIQGPSGEFKNEADAYGVADKRGRGRDNTFIDVNHDGYEDLYVGNKFPRTDGLESKNKLYINDGGDHFHSAPSYGVNRQAGGKIVQAVDYDGDTWKDILLCGGGHVVLYRNLRGARFKDVARRDGFRIPCESVLMANLNSDRRPDIAVVTWSSLRVLLQKPDHSFGHPRLAHRLHGGREIASGTVNADRLDDLYVVQNGRPNHDRPDRLYLNEGGATHLRSIRIPQTRRGKGDYVTSLDYDGNGRSDFLVMNGYFKHPGPVRLLATRP